MNRGQRTHVGLGHTRFNEGVAHCIVVGRLQAGAPVSEVIKVGS